MHPHGCRGFQFDVFGTPAQIDPHASAEKENPRGATPCSTAFYNRGEIGLVLRVNDEVQARRRARPGRRGGQHDLLGPIHRHGQRFHAAETYLDVGWWKGVQAATP